MSSSIIKQIAVYNNNTWDSYDIGANAENVALSSIEGLQADNIQEAIAGLFQMFPSDSEPLSVSQGGTGVSSITNLKVNLNSSAAGNPLTAGTIGVSGTLPVANGGTGRTSITSIKTNLGSTTAANALAGNIGVTGTLPAANGGTGRTSISSIKANLGSTTAANALAGNIGVTGTLPVANGGTGATTKRGYLDWTSLATTTGTTKKTFTLPSGYTELLITCLYPSNGTTYSGSVVIPRHLINATAREWYLGGGRSGKDTSSLAGRRACCTLTNTYITPIKLNIDGTEYGGNWTVYYR